MSSRVLDDPRVRRARTVVEAIITEVRAENVTFMAGSIAYHAFVSLVPFLLLVLFLISQVGDDALAESFLRAIAANLTPVGAAQDEGVVGQFTQVLLDAATSGTQNASISALSFAALIWGTLRIFRGLDQAFSDIYESESLNTFADQMIDGVIVFGALGIALFVVSAAERFIGVPTLGEADTVVRPLLSVLSIGIALFPMYYIFPDEDVTVREVIPGALAAAAGWTALSAVFRYYVAASSTSSYGIVGVIILLITWLYFGGLILLVGASINAVLSGRSEDVENIAWGAEPGTHHSYNDDDFVEPLRELEEALEVAEAEGYDEVRVAIDDREVTLPRPDEASVTVKTVDRPRLLGGDRETGRVLFQWDSRSDRRRDDPDA
ncbi:YihY/virulence factor BrkB family protein [Haloglomus halophilum]|uniref:YihY/virulence factor BrkB family protein n=1 Tax=Haloglomus halophilum TaxID=2962672 RepID=UPI0020C9E72C|nr:YihY/virulence factor BrkB family protein [Haloglomus halophilum]